MSLNSTTGDYVDEKEDQFLQDTKYLQDELVSEEIDSRMLYSQQAETVKLCLQKSFGKYTNDISLVNAFFIDLDFLMRQLQALRDYKGEKKGRQYEEVINHVILGDGAMIHYIVDHGMSAIKRMREDLLKTGRNEDEANDLIQGRLNTFVALLKEQIHYEKR